MTILRILESPFSWCPQIESPSSQHFLSYLMWLLAKNDLELVVVIPYETHQGVVQGLQIWKNISSSQIESSCVKWI